MILSADRRLLFMTNGGDNSVSSFGVGEDGKLTLIDVKRTGNLVTGRSGTAKSLAYQPATGTLFVLHSFGPDHAAWNRARLEVLGAPAPDLRKG